MNLKCRICLIKVEPDKCVNIFNESKTGQLISEILIKFASVKIEKDDGLPNTLCPICIEKVNVIVDFQTQIITSDLLLRKNENLYEETIKEEHDTIEAINYEEEIKTEDEPSPVGIDNDYDTHELITANRTEITKRKNFICEMCNKEFNTKRLLRRHEDKPLKCYEYDKAYKSPVYFAQHHKVFHTNIDYKCNVYEETINEEENLDCTPTEARETANVAIRHLLPIKSRPRYESSYNAFIKWCEDKNIKNYTENCLLAYFREISNHKKSLWSIFSMLKSCLNIKHNLDISKYSKLITLLKRKTEHHNPKKTRILDEEQVTKFIGDAPDNEYLLMKVVLIIGISGACRREELCKMLINDVAFKDDIIMVSIPETATHVKREFVITKAAWVKIITKFLKIRLLVKTSNERLFLTYRCGKCINSPVGINTFGKIPSSIAAYLELQNPQEYTGHCFRRSGATLLANKRR